jgi:hypothetical protein
MTVTGVEGAHHEQEEPSHHHMVYRTSLPYEPSHMKVYCSMYCVLCVDGHVQDAGLCTWSSGLISQWIDHMTCTVS